MLERMKATQMWQGGIRVAAILAAAQVPTALAKATAHSATVASIKAGVDCAGESAMNAAITVGQTLWATLDICMVDRVLHVAGALLGPNSAFEPVRTVAGIISHEVVGHVVSAAIQSLSGF
jgi:hypothetical protein